MYWTQILWVLSWPVLIAVSYLLVSYTLKKYEGYFDEENNA